MASFVKTRNGIFYLLACIDGRLVWRSTGARTREEAEAVARLQFPELLQTSTHGKLSDFLPQYLAYAETNLAPSTVLLYIPVHVLSQMFRGKFLGSLEKAYRSGRLK